MLDTIRNTLLSQCRVAKFGITCHVITKAVLCAGCCCILVDRLIGQEVFLEFGWQVSHGQLIFIPRANRCAKGAAEL